MRFVKGHGTGNDFVILPDPDGVIDLTPSLVRALCDRRRGIGADGVLRVVRTKAVPGAAVAGSRAGAADRAEWFMDYRNADGSLAEMCGNGIRVYARYLLDAGLALSGDVPIATRAGVKQVTAASGGDISVDLGTPVVGEYVTARIAGAAYRGLRISMGNPHVACVVDGSLSGLDLAAPPEVDPALFPDGVNVEVLRAAGDRHIEMRVHERGAGETRSCGTGAVAAAVAADYEAGRIGGTWRVDVPGGTLRVTLGASAQLAGPAVLVADGGVRVENLPQAQGGRPVVASHLE